jgi:hypothetical protein
MRIRVAVLLILLMGVAGHATAVEPHDGSHLEIAEGLVWRTSNNTDKDGDFLPRGPQVRVVNIFGFRNRPPVGAFVTVLPLDVKIAPIELRIVRSQEKETRCNPDVASTARLWWEVELEPVRQKQFGRTYIKIRNVWTLIGTSAPC